MANGSVKLYRFSWQAGTSWHTSSGTEETRTAVWVIDDPEDIPCSPGFELFGRYDLPDHRAHSDTLEMRVEVDLDQAAEWRAAADAYLSALQTAQRNYQRAIFFRRARYDKAASAAEAAY